MNKLALIHTSATLVPMFEKLCSDVLPANVEVFNIVDDSLIKDVITAGELTDSVSYRVAQYVHLAEQAGADQILVTCSSIGPAVESAAANAHVPVLRVDRPMADEAVARADRIGVIATLETTLRPTADLVRRRAAAVDKNATLIVRLCEGAFHALMTGETAKHDQMVSAALVELMDQVDIVLLAQASMARVASQLDASECRARILTSPPSAMEFLRQLC